MAVQPDVSARPIGARDGDAATAPSEPDGRLRVGLLVDGDSLPRWAEQIVRRINEGDYARVDLIVNNRVPGELAQVRDRARGDAGSPKAFLRKLWRNGPRLVYIGFRFLDDLLERRGDGARRGAPRYDDDVSASASLPHARVIDVVPTKTAFSDTFEPADIERIRAEGVDILFRLGFRILRGEVLEVARYGVWSYHHGDNRRMRGGPAGFWELTDGAPVVGVILQILNEDLDGGRVLSRSWHLPDALKLRRQSQNVFMQAMSHFPRQVERLHRLGPERYFAEVDRDNRDPDFYSRPLFVAPGNGAALRRLARLYARYAASKCAQLFFARQWVLLLRHARDGQLSQSMWRFDQLLPPSDRIWADPFAIERDGQQYVFVEEMIRGSGRGHIAVMRVTPDGRCSVPVPVLEKPYHLSYPFLFEHDGELYMVPESAENRTIDAYRCVEFPLRWEHAATLMSDVFAVDATLHRHEDRWWMFVTLRESDETDCLDELHLFHADHPLSGDWRAHPSNPISTDVRDARPAGAILAFNGERYRPAQNGSVRYGYGIGLHRIETLTVDDYRETLVSSITPDWDRSLDATHTLNRSGDLTVGDASRRRFRFARDRGMSRIRPNGGTSRPEPIPLLAGEPHAPVPPAPRRETVRVARADEAPEGAGRSRRVTEDEST